MQLASWRVECSEVARSLPLVVLVQPDKFQATATRRQIRLKKLQGQR